MEHRCGTRQKMAERVLVETRYGVTGKAVLREVSLSGGYVLCRFPVQLHSTVNVQFRAGSRGRYARDAVLAEVVRTTEEGFAIEWVEFAPQVIRSLCQQGVGRQVDSRATSYSMSHRSGDESSRGLLKTAGLDSSNAA